MSYDGETFVLLTKVQVHNGECSLAQVALGYGVQVPFQDTRKGIRPYTTDFCGRGMLTGHLGKTRVTTSIGLGIPEKTLQAIGQGDILQ